MVGPKAVPKISGGYSALMWAGEVQMATTESGSKRTDLADLADLAILAVTE